MTQAVRSERHGALVEIVLDRPKANAIDTATSRALGDAFIAFRDDPELRVAIVTGGGERFFSGGWDLKAAAEGDASADEDYGPGGFAGLTELFDLNKPVIAAVNGMAVGGGFELALAADLIVAAEHAEFFFPEVNIGILASAGGAVRLPRRIPRAIATEMLMTGRRMGAEEAARWGLVNAVVPADRLMPAARELAERLLAAAPLSLQAVKELLREAEGLGVQAAYDLMRNRLPGYQRMLASEDSKEGARAFAEKRPAVWKGR
jgi:crotonobetainyl-CoA hydratase